MAKKTVTLTLLKKNHGLKPFALNPKAFSESNEYINVLKRSLDKKGVLITNFFFINDMNTFTLKLQIFFKTQKLKKYLKKFKVKPSKGHKWKFFKRQRKKLFYQKRKKNLTTAKWDKIKRKKIVKNLVQIKSEQKNKIEKKITKKRLLSIKTKLALKKSSFLAYKNKKKIKKNEKRTNIFKNITKTLPINNLLIYDFEVLNGQVFTNISLKINKALRSFKKILFSRRITLYIDFLKITALFIAKKINLGTYNTILGTIFRFLLKRSHNKFFAFLEILFSLLIKAKAIVGIKICISGKLKGKLRAKPFNLIVGKVGTQKANSNIDFSKIHIHTLYGCFGFKTLIKYK